MAANTDITLGAQLESDRLHDRAMRLQAVVGVLRQRVVDHRRDGTRPPRGLTASLGEFERELFAVRRLLHTTRRTTR